MYEALNLKEAAALLAERTGKPFAKDNVLRIIQAGAQGRIPIYWRNSQQKFSMLFGFGDDVKESPQALRPMQLSLIDLSRLELADTIETHLFEPTPEDWAHLEKAGSSDGFRAITETGGATVFRDQLFVFEDDVIKLASLLIEALSAPVSHTNKSEDQGNAPATPMVAESASNTTAKPLQRGAAQEAAILDAIRSAGFDPRALPKNKAGKPGQKAEIRAATKGNSLFIGVTVFDKAWERLRKQGDIADKP